MAEFRGTTRYQVVRRLGEGGMGVVYEAFDRVRRGSVALKTLVHASPSALFRFKREFRSLADFNHPNLVTLHELVKHQQLWFFTMELVAGAPFLQWCRRTQMSLVEAPVDETMPTIATEMMPTIADEGEPAPVPASAVVALTPQGLRRLRSALQGLTEGLVALHDAQRLHRDVKPSNVLVTEAGRVVLLDFGLSADLTDPSGAFDLRRAEGTVAYMAPELDLDAPPTPAADWYAVGTMLYQALTGRLPFVGTVHQVTRDRQLGPPTNPSTLVPDLPPDLVRLCTDLLAIDPKARPEGRDVLRRLGARPPPRRTPLRPWENPGFVPPFTGRQEELATLHEALDRIQRGTATVVHVHGPPGIGKSALLRRFRQQAAAKRPAWLLSGRCFEHELVPFKAVDSVVDALSHQLKTVPAKELSTVLPPGIAALARLFPVLNRVAAIRARAGRPLSKRTPADLRKQAFAAFRGLLFALGRSRPVVMLIDDVQWGDHDSTAMLAEALGPPEPPPVLLVVTYPTDAGRLSLLRPLRKAPADSFEVLELGLMPLGSTDSELLARALLSAEHDDRSVDGPRTAWPVWSSAERTAQANTVAEESGGIPLFIYELAHAARSEYSATPSLQEPKLTIDDVVRHRAGRLPPSALTLLELLAVAGRPLPIALIKRAAGLPPGDRSALNALLRSHLARRGGADYVEPFHRRVGAAIQASLSTDHRKLRHEQLAAALGDDEDSDPTLLIAHLAEAGRSARAAETARRASVAMAAVARAQATEPSRRSLSSAEAGTDRFARQKERAKTLESIGRPEAADAYLEAAQLTPDVGRNREMRRRAADQRLRFGAVDDGCRLLQPILQDFGMPLPRSPRRAFARLAVERTKLQGQGLDWTEQRPDQFDLDLLQRTDACWTAAVGLSMVDPITSALYSSRYLADALILGDPNRVARALAMELALLTATGEPDTSRILRVLKTLRAVAKRIDAPYVRGFAALGAALAAHHEGRWAEASQCCRNAERVLRDQCTGAEWEISTAQALYVWSQAYLGRFANLRAALETYLGHSVSRANRHGTVMLTVSPMANGVWLADDDVETARQHLEESAATLTQETFRLPDSWAVSSRSQLDLYTGHGVRAFRRAAQQWSTLLRSRFLDIQVIRVEALYLRARAALAAVREDPTQRPLLSQARADAQRLIAEGPRWAQALGWLVESRVLAALGLRSEAQSLLEDAESTCDQADMPAHAAVAAIRRAQLQSTHSDAASSEGAAAAGPLTRLEALGVRNPVAYASLLAP